MEKTIYVVEFGITPRLVEAQVEKKPKTYLVLTVRVVIGGAKIVHPGQYIPVGDGRVFADKTEALQRLRSLAIEYRNECKQELERIERNLNEIDKMIDAPVS